MAEDERLAVGSKRADLVGDHYQAWKAAGVAVRLADESLEGIFRRHFPQDDDNNVRFKYQRYGCPAVFAHGKLGVADVIRLPGDGVDEYFITSLKMG